MAKLYLGILLVCLVAVSMAAQANTYTFTPNPVDLNDLDHWYYYSWGINWQVPDGESITSAVLKFDNINNWANETNVLYIHLLDNPKVGTFDYYDAQGGGDAFAGQGVRIVAYTDTDASKAENLTYDLSSLGLLDTFKSYASDGKFGFGMDPDCHYYVSKISLVVNTGSTTNVPESSGALAMAGGFASLVPFVTRWRKQAWRKM